VFAGGEKDLFDLATTFLGEILRCLRPFKIVFDFANAPFREVQGHDEQHIALPWDYYVTQQWVGSVKASEGTRLTNARVDTGTRNPLRA
jgi:hypothetical protein